MSVISSSRLPRITSTFDPLACLHVGKRLLHDAEHRRRLSGRHIVTRIGEGELATNAAAALEIMHERFDSRGEFRIVERQRPKIGGGISMSSGCPSTAARGQRKTCSAAALNMTMRWLSSMLMIGSIADSKKPLARACMLSSAPAEQRDPFGSVGTAARR